MGVFDVLRKLVGADPGKDGGEGRDRRIPRGGQGGSDEAWSRFEERLGELSDNGSGRPVVAGRMQTIGLHHVKEQMGDAWPRMVGKAHRFAQRVIERRLGPEDAWAQAGDDGYVLLFARLGRDEAAIKAASIGREITSVLLGELPGMEDMVVEVAVHEIDPAELEGGLGLPSLVAFFDRKKSEQASVAPAAAAAPPPEGDLEVLSFEYLPVWSPASPEIKLYHCVVRRGTVDHQDVVYSHRGPAPDAELECTVLRTALADVEAMLERKRSALVLVPVHWRTLTYQGLRRNYLEILQNAPAKPRGMIGFGICGIPEGTWQMSLLHHLPALAPFARFMMVHMEPEPNAVDCYRSTGVRTLVFDAAGLDPTDPQRRLQVETFARRALNGRFGVYAMGVDGRPAAAALRELGVGLMAGPAVAPPVGLPGTPSRPLLATA